VIDSSHTSPYAVLLLRVTLGAFFFIHGAIKLLVFAPAGTVRYFASLGLPPSLAYVIMTLELVGGIALIVGVWARIVALFMIAELIGTIVVTHAANGFLFTNPKGGWEFPAFWIVMLVVFILLGDGPYALKPTRWRS
jgi:putative oxidoreductase